ncbi:MAG: hypothetical protein L6300_06665 [Syntrophaceae bacterium]|nr:hypothetical protein [Syntrophaceae bacterium]
MRNIFTMVLLGVISIMVIGDSAIAGGPFYCKFDNSGEPIKWANGKIRWKSETGDLSPTVDNQTAVNWVAELFNKWQNAYIRPTVTADEIYTVSLDVAMQGSVGVDITAANYEDFIIEGESGITPIIFDYDGSITDAFLGEGMSDYVMGFASPRTADLEKGIIVNGQVVMNGKFIDGIDDNQSGDGDVSEEMFKSAILHEIGHLLNLDHTQLNHDVAQEILAEASKGALTSYAQHVPTMYPVMVTDGQYVLHKDDVGQLASIYPSTSFANNFCALRGKILVGDSEIGFPGVNIVVKNISSTANERIDAHSAVSGSYYEIMGLDLEIMYDGSDKFGEYIVHGLTPGQEYRVWYEPIHPSFVGGSSLEPYGYPSAVPPSGFGEGKILSTEGNEVVSCESGNTIIEMANIKLSGDYITSDLVDIVNEVSPGASTGGGSTSGDSKASGGCALIR